MHVRYSLRFGLQDAGSRLTANFVSNRCRVELHGSRLTVEGLSSTADRESEARTYAAALDNHLGSVQLLTEAESEYGTVPFSFQYPRGAPGKRDLELTKRILERQRDGLRKARRQTLEANPKLAQCYDYFDAAREDLEHVLFHLYKMIETIEEECGGGERDAVRALPDVAATIKDLKQLANDRDVLSRDQRHAPKGPAPATPLTPNEQTAALDDGHAILRKFEERFYCPPSRPPAS